MYSKIGVFLGFGICYNIIIIHPTGEHLSDHIILHRFSIDSVGLCLETLEVLSGSHFITFPFETYLLESTCKLVTVLRCN